jgi:hypothetical protein
LSPAKSDFVRIADPARSLRVFARVC